MQLEALRQVIASHDLVLAYCSTPDCNVCKVLMPKVQEMVAAVGDWEFLYVNVAESSEIAGQHLIFTVPTLLLFVQGREVKRFSRHFGLEALRGELVRYLELIRS